MKSMTKGWTWLLGSVLTLLGFSGAMVSCRKEYGCPTTDYKLVGNVTDKKGKPIEGIRVAIRQHRHYENSADVIYDQNDWYENDTLYTDDKGAFQLIRSVHVRPDDVKIVFEDIDGEENGGEYASAEAAPEVTRTKKGDNSWYGGTFEVQADVKLKKK